MICFGQFEQGGGILVNHSVDALLKRHWRDDGYNGGDMQCWRHEYRQRREDAEQNVAHVL